MNRTIFLSFLFTLFINPAFANTASIYFNGDILTMEGDSPKYAEALVVRGSEIAFVGDKSKAFAFADLEATNECNNSAQQKSPVKTQRPQASLLRNQPLHHG